MKTNQLYRPVFSLACAWYQLEQRTRKLSARIRVAADVDRERRDLFLPAAGALAAAAESLHGTWSGIGNCGMDIFYDGQTPPAKKTRKKRTRFPNICAFIQRAKVTRQHAYLVLSGQRQSRRLMTAWKKFQAETNQLHLEAGQ
ncbi:MAG: hypothetical protein LBK76_04605 [Verrucomicrobiales bacterium]|jgi:hypothetical protein|nr:hypothetical protein [Verrucomicrobiales bacterium]